MTRIVRCALHGPSVREALSSPQGLDSVHTHPVGREFDPLPNRDFTYYSEGRKAYAVDPGVQNPDWRIERGHAQEGAGAREVNLKIKYWRAFRSISG